MVFRESKYRYGCCRRRLESETVLLQVIAKAADGFSAGDIVNKRVRMHQSWSLMPFAAVIGSVYPAAYMRGSRETFGLYPNEMNFPRSVPDTQCCD